MSVSSRVLLLGAFVGALVAYVAARQAAPEKIGELEMALKTSTAALLARFEGFRAEPYLDEGRLWTIGFGHLIVPGDGFWHPDHNPNGVREITVEEARALKERDAADALSAVARCVRVPLTDNQHAALVSLAYNIGASAFCSSTLVKKLNAGDYVGAAEWFAPWNKVRDLDTGELIVSAGLSKRRAQEREIFLS